MENRWKVDYDEILGIIPAIWSDSQDEFWLQKVWDILNEAGMLFYDSEYDHLRIKLFAISAAAIYLDFNGIVFEEYGYYDTLHEQTMDYGLFDEKEIVYLYARLTQEDYPDSLSEALFEMENKVRPQLMHALLKKLSIAEICMGLYYTVQDYNLDTDEDDDYYDGDDEYDDEKSAAWEPESQIGEDFYTYNGFWNLITNQTNDMIDAARHDLLPAYEWIDDGAYQILE